MRQWIVICLRLFDAGCVQPFRGRPEKFLVVLAISILADGSLGTYTVARVDSILDNIDSRFRSTR